MLEQKQHELFSSEEKQQEFIDGKLFLFNCFVLSNFSVDNTICVGQLAYSHFNYYTWLAVAVVTVRFRHEISQSLENSFICNRI